MQLRKYLARAAVAAAVAGVAPAVLAHPAPGAASGAAPEAALDATRQVFDRAISNIAGKSLIAVEVNYAPGEKSAAHRHEGSAFIMAYVVSGAIRSQVAGEPARVYRAGETWYENPGAHHVVSENASATEPAKLLAVFVVDTKHGALTTFDHH